VFFHRERVGGEGDEESLSEGGGEEGENKLRTKARRSGIAQNESDVDQLPKRFTKGTETAAATAVPKPTRAL
jgi:hypothetical protein